MQLLLIRHAQPLASVGEGSSDPALSELGVQMAERLPVALRRFGITRIVSSPQLRAHQTAEPLGAALGLPIETDPRFAEYDFGLDEYVPVEQMLAENPDALARLLDGHLPAGVDENAFRERVLAANADVAAAAQPSDRVAVFTHGGVINVVLGDVLGTPALFPFRIDYVSVSQVGYYGPGKAAVVGVNNIEHVWDLLPRLNRR
jgi:probable phosphoglycerate mutase